MTACAGIDDRASSKVFLFVSSCSIKRASSAIRLCILIILSGSYTGCELEASLLGDDVVMFIVSVLVGCAVEVCVFGG